MTSLKIPSEDALVLYHEQADINGVRFVDLQFDGEWRWGNNYQLIVQDVLTEKYYSVIVREQIGDHWYLSLENEGEFTTFTEVERVPVTTYEYRKPGHVE